MNEQIHGIVQPTVTPFREDGSIDEAALRDDTRYLIEMAGSHGRAVCGSEGDVKLLADLLLMAGDHAKGRELHEQLVPIWNVIFADNRPANTRCCMELQGRDGGVPCPPMPSTSDAQKGPIHETLAAAGPL